MLKENSLFGDIDKVSIALMRIKEFEPIALQNNPAGFYVCISGGKDSTVIQELCLMAGFKCEFIHNHTSVDNPKTVYFVRKEKKRIENLGYIFRIDIPRGRDGKQKTMFNKIPSKGLPLRSQRWCCEELKEYGGKGRYCITGVRWAESSRRANQRSLHEISGDNKTDHIILNNDNDMKRKLSEICILKEKLILNPIIDWSDDDVWEFIKKYNLPFNPLYEKGWKRVGCIGCPMGNGRKELDMFPKYKNAYFKAAAEYWRRRQERIKENDFPDPESYFEWWLNG